MSNELITVTVVGSETTATVTSGAEVVVTIGDVGPVSWSAVTGKPTTFPPQAHSHAIGDVTGLTAALAQKVELDPYGKVLASQLPSYVDDVLEFANAAARPATGETGKIYVTLDNGKIFRWSGSTYIEISAAPGSTDFVPEGTGNLYHTTARAAAAAPVQSVAGRTGAVTLAVADVSGAVGTTDARLTDAREWSAATVTQAEAEAGTSTSRLAFSPLRVFQAVAAWWAASAAKTKLDGIATGATANATDAQLRNRATHTGTQAHTTITGLGGAAALNVGTTAGTVAAGDDSRLTDQRVPTDGSVTTAKLADGAVTAAKIAASQTVTFGSVSAGTLAAGAGGVTATTGRLAVLGIGATTLFEVSSTGVVTTGTWQATAVAVDYGGTGATSASAARTNLGVAYGTTAGTVCEGNDSRLSNARTPTSHASTHQTGQADAINPVIVTPSSLSASQNDYAPGVCDIIRLSSSTAIDLTGLVAGTVDGAMRLVINTNASGGAAITLKHESASSTAANRFRSVTAADVVLLANGGSAVLTYSSAISRWRIL